MMQQPTVIGSPQPAQYSIIFLHGLGGHGDEFVPLIKALALPDDHTIRFILPHADHRAVTINGGEKMPAWYDITMIGTLDRQVDTQGIQHSVDQVKTLIAQEHDKGIAFENIVVAGFSQGGVIATYTALQFNQALGGVWALSTYAPAWSSLIQPYEKQVCLQTPFFVAHGQQDDVVPMTAGKQLVDHLAHLDLSAEWYTYSMGHEIIPQEVQALRQWLKTQGWFE